MSLFLVCLSQDILMPIRQSRRKRKSKCEDSPVIIPHLRSFERPQLLISVLLSFYTDTLSTSSAFAGLLLSIKQQTVHLIHSVTDTDLVPDKDEVPTCHVYLIQCSLLWLIVCWRFRTTPCSSVSMAVLNTSTVGVVRWTAFQNMQAWVTW